ncbi:MAG: hypothetical protein PHN69_03800 [Candidatus Pacebacteria bacterium]|nr:hypothetical protein [Candidatus Paceibacterota bacterium]
MYTWNGIEIPEVASVDPTFEEICDSERTAGGYLREDMIAIKRSWKIQTAPITWEQASPLVNDYRSTMGAEGDFLPFGEVYPIKAKLKIDNMPTTPFMHDGVWQRNAVTLSLTITEV